MSASSPVMRDLLVAQQLMTRTLKKSGHDCLSDNDIVQIGTLLSASPEAQQRKRSEGKAAATAYLIKVLDKAAEAVARSQRRSRQKDQGIER